MSEICAQAFDAITNEQCDIVNGELERVGDASWRR